MMADGPGSPALVPLLMVTRSAVPSSFSYFNSPLLFSLVLDQIYNLHTHVAVKGVVTPSPLMSRHHRPYLTEPPLGAGGGARRPLLGSWAGRLVDELIGRALARWAWLWCAMDNLAVGFIEPRVMGLSGT